MKVKELIEDLKNRNPDSDVEVIKYSQPYGRDLTGQAIDVETPHPMIVRIVVK